MLPDRRSPRGTTWVWRLEPALPCYPTQIRPAMAAINPGPNRTMNMEVPFQRYILQHESTWRIAYGRRENRGETERALRGHRLHRTTRHERKRLANSGKDRPLSLRCIHEKAVL